MKVPFLQIQITARPAGHLYVVASLAVLSSLAATAVPAIFVLWPIGHFLCWYLYITIFGLLRKYIIRNLQYTLAVTTKHLNMKMYDVQIYICIYTYMKIISVSYNSNLMSVLSMK